MTFSNVPISLWALLALGPVAFLICFAALSVAFSVTGTAPSEVPARVTEFVPHCLAVVLALVGVSTLLVMRSDALGAWKLPPVPVFVVDFLIGALVGAVLAAVYLMWLQHLVGYLQRNLGDYVPAGSILPVLSGSILVFFVANVLLAPLVEETLYRGIALPVLGANLGVLSAVILSCVAFGLLHWAGGFWYMLLTGLLAGGIFAGLYYWRGGVAAPFAAHLVLNLIEFAYAYSLRNQL